MKNLKKVSREGMKSLNTLKNKGVKDLSKFKGAGSYQMTERSEGNCVITDVVNYDDHGNVTGRKDMVTSVCG